MSFYRFLLAVLIIYLGMFDHIQVDHCSIHHSSRVIECIDQSGDQYIARFDTDHDHTDHPSVVISMNDNDIAAYQILHLNKLDWYQTWIVIMLHSDNLIEF